MKRSTTVRHAKLSIVSTLLGFSLLASCKSTEQFSGECLKNEDCPIGAFCKRTRGDQGGLCACRTDEACAEGEVCNTQGVCQKRDACRSNAECEAAKFCDVGTGDCIDRTACGTDVHCLPGSVCNKAGDRCLEGCFGTADCPLYSVCERTGLTSTTALGRCLMGKCDDKTFCPYGSRCVNGTCTRDTDPNHCADCDPSQGASCGSARNYCLVNPGYDPRNPQTGSQNFCGVECRSEEDCPNGYQCGGVVLLTQDQCTSNANCGGGGRVCAVGEGDLRGFCTCVVDSDCTIDTVPPTCLGSCGGVGIQICFSNADCLSGNCVPTQCIEPQGQSCTADAQCQPAPLCGPYSGIPGVDQCLTDGSPCNTSNDCLCVPDNQLGPRCFGTGRPCNQGADCLLACEFGGCLLGASCAPLQGLACPDVRRL